MADIGRALAGIMAGAGGAIVGIMADAGRALAGIMAGAGGVLVGIMAHAGGDLAGIKAAAEGAFVGIMADAGGDLAGIMAGRSLWDCQCHVLYFGYPRETRIITLSCLNFWPFGRELGATKLWERELPRRQHDATIPGRLEIVITATVGTQKMDRREKEVPLTITYAQYDGLLTADNTIEMTVICSYEPVEGALIVQTNVVLDNPKFEIKVNGPTRMNHPAKAEVVFTNPLDQVVSDIVVTAEGNGLLRDPITVKAGSVKPKETIAIPLTITPYKSGSRHLLVDVTSNKFQNAKGYVEVEVHQPEEEKKS
ncbi:protein-glutamine gamma-glutamyltransferase 2-like [Mantella aurantiaca]